MTRYTTLDDATMRALERHETHAHAIPSREVRDLGDAYRALRRARPRPVLEPDGERPLAVDARRVRPPADGGARAVRRPRPGAARLAVAAPLARPRTSWSDSARTASATSAEGHVMVLEDPGTAAPPVPPDELGAGVTLLAIVHGRGRAGRATSTTSGSCSRSRSGPRPRVPPSSPRDLRLTLTDDPRVLLVLARVDGEPRRGRQGDDVRRVHVPVVDRDARGVPGSRAGADRDPPRDGPRRSRRRGSAYLGVWTGNEPALRVYERSRVRLAGRVAGPAARMMRWARLTWQVPDPATFAPALAHAAGRSTARGRRRARAGRPDDRPRHRRGSRSGRGCGSRRRTIRLARRAARAGARAGRRADARGCRRDRRRRGRRHERPLRLAGVGWATVELDRAADELGMWLGEAPDPDAPDDRRPAARGTGAGARRRRAAGRRGASSSSPPPRAGSPRRSPATARVPCALYLRPAAGLRAWAAAARARGVTLGARRVGPLGGQVLARRRAVAGPHLVIVDDGTRARASRTPAAGTIAP